MIVSLSILVHNEFSLGAHMPPVIWALETLSFFLSFSFFFFFVGLLVKQAGHVGDNSPSPSAKVESVGAVPSLSTYGFMAHGFLPLALLI